MKCQYCFGLKEIFNGVDYSPCKKCGGSGESTDWEVSEDSTDLPTLFINDRVEFDENKFLDSDEDN